MNKIILTIILLLISVNLFAQKIQFADTVNGKTVLREVSYRWPLPVKLTGSIPSLTGNNIWTGTNTFSTLIADLIIANRVDSTSSIRLYDTTGNLYALFSADTSYIPNLTVGNLNSTTIINGTSVTTNSVVTDTLISNSPFHIRTDSVYFGLLNDTSKVWYNEYLFSGNKRRGVIYPNIDYGMNLGRWDRRIDTVNARVIGNGSGAYYLTLNYQNGYNFLAGSLWTANVRIGANNGSDPTLSRSGITNNLALNRHFVPLTDYGFNLGDYNTRWDTVNARNGKFTNVVTADNFQSSNIKYQGNGFISGATNAFYLYDGGISVLNAGLSNCATFVDGGSYYKGFVFAMKDSAYGDASNRKGSKIVIAKYNSNQNLTDNIFEIRDSAFVNLKLAIKGNGTILAPNGSATAPSYSFSASTNTGLYFNNTKIVNTLGGNNLSSLGFAGLIINSSYGYIQFASDVINGTGRTTYIDGSISNNLSVLNGTSAQSFNVYDKYTDASNYRRLKIGWTADSTAVISTENAGQYTNRDLLFSTGTGNQFRIGNNGVKTFYNPSNTGQYLYMYISNGVLLRSVGGSLTFNDNGNNIVMTLPTYADDAAAATGGLTAGMLYKTATGEVRIKL